MAVLYDFHTAEPGMSGGFATLPRDEKTIAACGVVCADNSTEEARRNSKECGESVISFAWAALGLRVPELVPSISTTPTHTLHSLMSIGRMDPAIGGIDHIDVIEGEGSDCSIHCRFTP